MWRVRGGLRGWLKGLGRKVVGGEGIVGAWVRGAMGKGKNKERWGVTWRRQC